MTPIITWNADRIAGANTPPTINHTQLSPELDAAPEPTIVVVVSLVGQNVMITITTTASTDKIPTAMQMYATPWKMRAIISGRRETFLTCFGADASECSRGGSFRGLSDIFATRE